MELGLDIVDDLEMSLGNKTLTFSAPQELTAEDVERAKAYRGSKPAELSRLRPKHHALAKLLAQGQSLAACSIHTGYNETTISNLQKDPMFINLVRFYQQGLESESREVAGRLVGLNLEALDELEARLEAKPEEFTTAQLMDIIKTMSDRTGHGPSSSSTNVNITANLGDRLAAAKARVVEARRKELPND